MRRLVHMTTHTTALATTLISLAADYLSATRPIDTKTTKAALDGAARATHAIGYGPTPAAITLVALDYARAHTRPALGAGFPHAYRTWAANGTTTVAAALDTL
jgi:hypothetical protein